MTSSRMNNERVNALGHYFAEVRTRPLLVISSGESLT
jgi:hypothetical protein